MAKKENKTVKIKLVKSLIGSTQKQIKVVSALGLKKKDQTVEHAKSATIMGMVNSVKHLLEVTE